MYRKILSKVCLPLIAAPLISLLTTPAAVAESYNQQQLWSGRGVANHNPNLIIISDRDNDYRDTHRYRNRRIREHRRQQLRKHRRQIRRIHRDNRRLRHIRRSNYHPYYRNRRNYNRYYYNRHYRIYR
jgi:hypothetical protein